MMMHWGNLFGTGYGGFGWIVMLLFWALLILGIFSISKHLLGSRQVREKESAEDILRKRYAAGELSTDEFNERLSVITKGKTGR